MKKNDHDLKEFIATVEKEDKFIFVSIPFSPREVWGAKPRFSVTGTINDVPVRGTLGALGKNYFLRLSAAWLKNSGIDLNTEVTVKLSPSESQSNFA